MPYICHHTTTLTVFVAAGVYSMQSQCMCLDYFCANFKAFRVPCPAQCILSMCVCLCVWARVNLKFAIAFFLHSLSLSFFSSLSDRMERPLKYDRRRGAVVLPVAKYAGHICFEVKITCSIK